LLQSVGRGFARPGYSKGENHAHCVAHLLQPLDNPFGPEIEYRSRTEARSEEIRPVEDAHSLLRAVYSNPSVPLNQRMRAAIEALPVERPKLAVSATIDHRDFGSMLERAIQRSRETNRTNGMTKVIEHQADEGSQARAKVSDFELDF
jgi:hypothetical protein